VHFHQIQLKFVYTTQYQHLTKSVISTKVAKYENSRTRKAMIAKSKKIKIENSAEAWELGELGELGSDLKHARVVDKKIGAQIDAALGLQMISIRLEQELIESYKLLGAKYDMGYQPLMREALKRFVEGEFKLIASEALEKQRAEKQKSSKRMAKAA
jgi:uncharacterized protein (DUF4415 family)